MRARSVLVSELLGQHPRIVVEHDLVRVMVRVSLTLSLP